MSARERMVSDASAHLTDELVLVLQRHLKMVRAGGFSLSEGCAVAMTSAEEVLVKAAGIMMVGLHPSVQPIALDELVRRVARNLERQKPSIIAGVSIAREAVGL